MNYLMFAILTASTVIAPLGSDQQTPGARVKQAQALMEAGELQKGRTLLQDVVTKNPAYIDAYLILGKSLLKDVPSRSRIAAIQALKQAPENQQALDLLTASYQQARAQGIDQAQELKLRKLEIGDYLVVLQARPELADVLYRTASQRLALERLLPASNTAERESELKQAIQELEKLNTLLGNNSTAESRASARYKYARALKHLGDFEKSQGQNPVASYRKSVEQFDACLNIKPERIDALGEIVLIHQTDGKLDLAVDTVNKHLDKVASKWARAKTLSMVGNLYAQLGNNAEAIQSLEQALQLDNGFMDTYLGLYQIYQQEGKREQAKQTLVSATERQAGFLTGHLLLGQMAVEDTNYESAMKYFTNVLNTRPESAVVLGMLPSKNLYRNRLYYSAAGWMAWLHFEHGKDLDRALKLIDVAASYQAIEPRLLDTQGWIYFKKGDYKKAREILEKASQQDNSIPAIHYHLAKTLLALGERKSAWESINTALSLNTEFSEIADARALYDEMKSQ